MTSHDRCDRCNAQANVKATGINGDLLFCGYHFRKAESAIRAYAYEIEDSREWQPETVTIP